jgi:hypothetical protein
MGAALLLLAAGWRGEQAPSVPAGRQATVLAACRDALEERLEIDLGPEVVELPSVVSRGDRQYRLTGLVMVEDEKRHFGCDVDLRSSPARVHDVHLLDF